MTTQIRQSELVRLLSADFQKRNEPQFSHANSIPCVANSLGLVGLWPTSSIDAPNTGNVQDISGNGLHATSVNNPEANNDGLIPYIDIESGTPKQLTVADSKSISITGTETSINAAKRGMTIFIWVNFDTAIGTQESPWSKWDTGTNNRSWLFVRRAAGNVEFRVSVDGIASTSVQISTSNTFATGVWGVVAARFDPSTEMKIWQKTNGVDIITATNTTSIPASIFDSAADLRWGGSNAGTTNVFDGKISLCSLHSAALPDFMVENIINQPKISYGVF